jgi:hypothetical protein
MRTFSQRAGLGIAALLTTAIGPAVLASPASAAPAGAPDTTCMRAGIAVLKQAGLFPTVARSGLPISVAVSVGVTPRAGTDVSALPDPLPLSVVLRDHLAGDQSLFIYPWC